MNLFAYIPNSDPRLSDPYGSAELGWFPVLLSVDAYSAKIFSGLISLLPIYIDPSPQLASGVLNDSVMRLFSDPPSNDILFFNGANSQPSRSDIFIPLNGGYQGFNIGVVPDQFSWFNLKYQMIFSNGTRTLPLPLKSESGYDAVNFELIDAVPPAYPITIESSLSGCDAVVRFGPVFRDPAHNSSFRAFLPENVTCAGLDSDGIVTNASQLSFDPLNQVGRVTAHFTCENPEGISPVNGTFEIPCWSLNRNVNATFIRKGELDCPSFFEQHKTTFIGVSVLLVVITAIVLYIRHHDKQIRRQNEPAHENDRLLFQGANAAAAA